MIFVHTRQRRKRIDRISSGLYGKGLHELLQDLPGIYDAEYGSDEACSTGGGERRTYRECTAVKDRATDCV